jgi:hypothetical protein
MATTRSSATATLSTLGDSGKSALALALHDYQRSSPAAEDVVLKDLHQLDDGGSCGTTPTGRRRAATRHAKRRPSPSRIMRGTSYNRLTDDERGRRQESRSVSFLTWA